MEGDLGRLKECKCSLEKLEPKSLVELRGQPVFGNRLICNINGLPLGVNIVTLQEYTIFSHTKLTTHVWDKLSDSSISILVCHTYSPIRTLKWNGMH
jgi:hypothetical protein